jgi:phenylacetic acid degradation operon negative regulatory protein
MKAKTELLLYRLLWLADKPMRPTFRNLEQSFEGWAYHEGLLAQIGRLEAQGLLESRRDPRTGERLHRLTEAGRLAAGGGRDPEARWATKWDRKWRLFLFDVPESERSSRRRLTRALEAAGCGCLQGSAWISAHLPPSIEAILAEDDADCSHLLLLLADSKGPQVDARMVASAWDFDGINALYRAVSAVLERLPAVVSAGRKEEFEEWSAAEQGAWGAALRADPLLPAELLPDGYLGRAVSRQRRAALAKASRFAASIKKI